MAKKPDLVEDDDFDIDDLDMENDPDLEDLPEADEIDGYAGMDDDDDPFGDDYVERPLGRTTSVPLYNQAAADPNISALQVYLNDGGNFVSLGEVPPRATEADVIRKFFDAMPPPGGGSVQLELRPCDSRGKLMGVAFTKRISEHHAELKRLRNIHAAQKGEKPAPGTLQALGIPPELWALLQKSAETERQRAELLAQQLEAERQRQREIDSQIAKERIDLATNAASGVQAITERMMNSEAQRAKMAQEEMQQRHATMNEQLSAMFQGQLQSNASHSQTMLQMMMQQREAERARAEENARLDRERWEREQKLRDEQMKAEREEREARRRQELEEMRLRFEEANKDRDRRVMEEMRRAAEEREAERIRRREEQEAKERREREERERRERLDREDREERARRWQQEMLESQRKHELTIKEIEAQRQREREDADRRSEQEREHQRTMTQLQLATLDKKYSRDDGLENTLLKGAGLLKMLGMDPADTVRRLFGGDEDEGGGDWTEAVPKMFGAAAEVLKEGLKAKAAQAQAQINTPAMGTAPLLGMNTFSPMPPVVPRATGEKVPVGTAPTEPIVNSSPPEGPPPDFDPEEFDIAAAVGDVPIETQDGQVVVQDSELEDAAPPELSLGLKAQRTCRKALRKLIPKLRAKPEAEWEQEIMFAISMEPTIYQFLKERGIYGAAIEAGASVELANRIVEVVDESGQVPEEIPRRID